MGKKEIGEDYVNTLVIPRLPEVISQQIDNPIELNEISLAAFELANNKAPGSDGIPIDFYKIFWNKIKEFLLHVFEEIVQDQKMHLSARRGIISLFEKPGRDRLFLKNWRLISLLNADYKIFSKIITRRLQIAVQHIIADTQTGFMNGKLIGQNIIQLLNIMDYCENKRKSAVVISFDFEKAFDKIQWKAIDLALDKFSFGEYLKKLIAILYTGPVSTVMNNDFWGDWIKLERSTRQGCPSSAPIFAIIIELLGISIRSDVRLEGLETENFTYLLGQYADDLWVVLQPEESNMNRLLEIMESFCTFAGLNVNYNKTVAFKLGPCRDSNAKFYTKKELAWSEGPIKILGIYLHPDREIMEGKNFGEKIVKIEQILKIWSRRNLTPIGKITLINSLVVSQLVYLFMNLPTPDEYYFRFFKTQIIDFLWEGKQHKIRFEKLIQQYQQGGLKLPDLHSKNLAIKTKWVQYAKDNEIPWFYQDLPIKDARIWACNLQANEIKKIVKQNTFGFAKDVLIVWSNYNYILPTEFEEIYVQLICGNSEIKRAMKPFFDKELLDSDVEYVHQLIDNEKREFYTRTQLFEHYDLQISDLLYNQIKAAIPPAWRAILKYENREQNSQNIPIVIETNFDRITKSVTKHVYGELVQKKYRIDGAKLGWELDLKSKIDEQTWENLFINVLKLTDDTKLRFFHYEIINRTLTTNLRISKWNEQVSPKCSYCKEEQETILHLLVRCPKIEKLWTILVKWVKYFYKTEIVITPQTIVLNNYQGKAKEMVNLLILMLKRYVYVTRCLGETDNLNFKGFMKRVNMQYRIEKIAAFHQNNIKNFKRKWKIYEAD